MAMYRLRDHAMVQEVGGEMVLLHLKEGKYYELNEVGCAMIKAVTTHDTLDQAVDAIHGVFDAGPAEIREDLNRLLKDLESHELLEKCAG